MSGTSGMSGLGSSTTPKKHQLTLFIVSYNENIYVIENVATDKLLTLEGNIVTGINVVIADREDGLDRQQWYAYKLFQPITVSGFQGFL